MRLSRDSQLQRSATSFLWNFSVTLTRKRVTVGLWTKEEVWSAIVSLVKQRKIAALSSTTKTTRDTHRPKITTSRTTITSGLDAVTASAGVGVDTNGEYLSPKFCNWTGYGPHFYADKLRLHVPENKINAAIILLALAARTIMRKRWITHYINISIIMLRISNKLVGLSDSTC